MKAGEQEAQEQEPAAMRKGSARQTVQQPEDSSDEQEESGAESEEDISVDLDSSDAEPGSDEEQQAAGSSDGNSSALEEGEEEEEESSSESDSGSDASSPPAARSGGKRGRAARQPAAKPAARRGSRAARQQPPAEEASSESEEESDAEEQQPVKRSAAARQQAQRRPAAQRQTRSAADDSASEASGASGRRASSRQRAGGSQGAAPSRLGRGSSRLQQQGQEQPEQQEQQPSLLFQWVAAGDPPNSGSLSKLTVAQLQAECSSLGLPEDGKKPQLVGRLLEWWEQQAAQPQQAAAKQRTATRQQQQQQQQGGTAAGKRKGRQIDAAGEEAEEEEEQLSEQPAAKRRRRGAQPAAAPSAQAAPAQQGRQRRQQQAAAAAQAEQQLAQQQQREEEEEEDEDEELQRGRKRRSARKLSGKRQAAAAAGERSPAPRARRRGSPAPAAAAQQLEMSLPPEGAGAAAAAAAARRSDVDMADAEEEAAAAAAAAARSRADPAEAAAGYLRRRLTQPRSSEAATMALRPRLQEVHRSLLDSLTATVELGHNNSLLIVGPRGSGKTLVAERALADLAAEFNKDPKDPVVGVIRLSGQVHADERTAFKELARQLCSAFGYQFSKAASVAENIEFLRGMLARLQSCDKVALFLLDDFDGFAGKRAKQTVLYNLLDALQTSGMQAAVVGVTCRQDVVELLEKRVKSRFSHRKLDVSLPNSALPVAAQPAEDRTAAPAREAQDGALDILQSMLTLPPQFAHREYTAKWNASVAAAVGSGEVKQALQRCVNIFPSLRHLANVADWALGAAASSGALSVAALVAALQRQISQAKGMITMIGGLPILDLILLVAVQRLAQRGKLDVNFEMAHHEFCKYALVGAHVDSYSRGAAAKAYDHLLSLGLLAFVDPRSEARVGSRQYAPAYLLVTREEVEEGLAAHHNCPQSLSEWLKKEGGLGTTAGHFLR
ncbi:Origin recognition complex subunit 4 [Chlorella sorokiniana]|uniref:Origin recognition complex subunit 4 n=1 Tax=Chlorella sorokiniana TaxID=3076 RepID=A0A2P6TIW4_CHLSO|nr:Origin recognition complex subunit 4 [Chlorella sorokiniana]|eukprot:PRW39188.1 Origin recognition complex subunit 4 [Chlorella sorokiniana]